MREGLTPSRFEVDASILDAMRAYGASPEDVEAVARTHGIVDGQDPEPPCFEVGPDEWPIVLLFLELSTQWEWTGFGMGGIKRTALPANRVESFLRCTRTPNRQEVMRQINLMARAALEAQEELIQSECDES